MAISMTYVGLDVHQETTRIVILPDQGLLPLDAITLPTRARELTRYLQRWASQYPLQCFYEASSCGYVPYRWLTAAGVPCTVVAPSKIPRAPGDRVKTDQRDARALAVQGRTGGLTAVHVPTPEEEAVRSLARCREARHRDVVAARHRVLRFLQTRGSVYPGPGKRWTQAHWRWLRARTFADLDEWTYQEYLTDLDYRVSREAESMRRLLTVARSDHYLAAVGALCCFRGIAELTAITLLAETIDFRRFGTAPGYMCYLGLTCAEDSSGPRRRLGGITKAGNPRCRRVLVEAAWHARHKPVVSVVLKKRQQGQPPEIVALAWKAQQRLHARYWRVEARAGSRRAAVAVARELSGFVWAAMTLLAERPAA